MILKEKGILDSTLLKIVAKVLKNNASGVKGFKVKTLHGVESVGFEELIQFVETLAKEFEEGNYDEIKKCDTCGNYGYPGSRSGKGWCSGSAFDKKRSDYCSGWVPMTSEQKYIRSKMHEHWGLQTKRAGDGSEDSNESNRPTASRKAKRRTDS